MQMSAGDAVFSTSQNGGMAFIRLHPDYVKSKVKSVTEQMSGFTSANVAEEQCFSH